ncbi:MAG: NAD(P)/FAD-dependent oxidoreductase [Pirellulales bacterium]
MNDRYDALVIGGGPAGSTAAGLLARAGWSVLLVEREAFPRRKVCGEYLSSTNWPFFQRLGLGRAFARMAGPEVRRVALFCGKDRVAAELPGLRECEQPWGRALSRQCLDAWLLAEAVRVGVEVRQLEQVEEVAQGPHGFTCRLAPSQAHRRGKQAAYQARAAVVIGANGSWTPSPLGIPRPRSGPRAGDLFGFKAHFLEAHLPSGLMPLISFPGGYGGMVECEGGRVSLSCCVRRDRLARLPRGAGQSAGEALLVYLLDSCSALRAVLEPAVVDGPWLSAGPIRPGIRACYEHGIFRVGNAAGEAHPVVAEGISMALQSAWLLAERLIAAGRPARSFCDHDAVGRDYQAAWRRAFAPRIRAAAAVAHWAMHPAAVRCALPLVRRFPQLLTWGACQSGKATRIVPATT